MQAGGHRPGIVAVTASAGGCGRCLARIMMLPAVDACPVCPPAGSKACARVGRRRDTSNRPASALTKLSLQRDRSGPMRLCPRRACLCAAACAVPTETDHKTHTEAPAEVQTEHYREHSVCRRSNSASAVAHEQTTSRVDNRMLPDCDCICSLYIVSYR